MPEGESVEGGTAAAEVEAGSKVDDSPIKVLKARGEKEETTEESNLSVDTETGSPSKPKQRTELLSPTSSAELSRTIAKLSIAPPNETEEEKVARMKKLDRHRERVYGTHDIRKKQRAKARRAKRVENYELSIKSRPVQDIFRVEEIRKKMARDLTEADLQALYTKLAPTPKPRSRVTETKKEVKEVTEEDDEKMEMLKKIGAPASGEMTWSIQIRCENLPMADQFSKSDPICVVKELINKPFDPNVPAEEWTEVCRTEPKQDEDNPNFYVPANINWDVKIQKDLKFIVYDTERNKLGESLGESSFDFFEMATKTLEKKKNWDNGKADRLNMAKLKQQEAQEFSDDEEERVEPEQQYDEDNVLVDKDTGTITWRSKLINPSKNLFNDPSSSSVKTGSAMLYLQISPLDDTMRRQSRMKNRGSVLNRGSVIGNRGSVMGKSRSSTSMANPKGRGSVLKRTNTVVKRRSINQEL